MDMLEIIERQLYSSTISDVERERLEKKYNEILAHRAKLLED